MTDIFAFCERELPQWNAISVSGYHIREAGSTAVQEVAFTLANGIAYIEAGRARGLSAETLGERMSFFFAAHNDFLEEIAKFRAARRMWARIMKERFGVTSPRAQQLRFHAQTAGSTLTAQQPDNNLVRVTVQALAAVLGGAQSLHCNSRDEALALPTEESATLALRTQQIIAHESGVANTVDPVGGSYEIESRTNAIEQEARLVLDTDRRRRGHAGGDRIGHDSARDSGVGVSRAARDRQRRIARGGGHEVSDRARAPTIPTFRIDPEIERAQQARVAAVRAARDAGRMARVARCGSRRRARGTAISCRSIIAAVQANATVGEISDTLREVFGEHREVSSSDDRLKLLSFASRSSRPPSGFPAASCAPSITSASSCAAARRSASSASRAAASR